MEVVVRSRNIEVTAALKAHVEKKVRQLDKFLSNAGKAQVRLEIEHGRHTAEVTIPVAGWILRGEEKGEQPAHRQAGDEYAIVARCEIEVLIEAPAIPVAPTHRKQVLVVRSVAGKSGDRDAESRFAETVPEVSHLLYDSRIAVNEKNRVAATAGGPPR